MALRARVTLCTWSLVAVLAHGCSCESEKVEQQRELLAPKKRDKERAKLVDGRRYTENNGELRPSDQKVAGLTLPRGLELHREFENEWYYRTLHRDITLERLEEFFRPQLVVLRMERYKTGAVQYKNAQLEADPSAPLVSLRLAPVLNGVGRNEVYIKRAPPRPKELPSAAEAEAQLRAMRKYAD